MTKSEVTKKRGGARKNAGRPKGKQDPQTIERNQVLQAYKDKILRHADQFFRTQKVLAFGHYEIFIVEHYEDANGKVKRRHVLVEEPELMANILDDPELTQGDNYVIVRKVEADKYTLEAMLDRAMGKASQTVDINADITTNINTIPDSLLPNDKKN